MEKTVGKYLEPALLVLTWLALCCANVGCAVLNTPVEERVFFPSDWQCNFEEEALVCFPPEDLILDGFMFVGKKRFTEDEAIIEDCIDAALVERELDDG